MVTALSCLTNKSPTTEPAGPLSTLAVPPFRLDPEAIAWVRRTRDGMDLRRRLQHLFVLQVLNDDPQAAAQRMAHHPGGVHRVWSADVERGWRTTRTVLEHAEVPPLVSGDLEGGGFTAPCATPLPNALGIAAMAQPALAAEVLQVLAAEARAMGFNWSFTPVIDIAHRPDSGIVGTRSYGSSLDTVLAHALQHVGALQGAGLATTAKHWPGEGYDRRDQHLVTTVNPLDWDTWLATFGRLYKALFAAGVLTVMPGHIAWPAGAQRLNAAAGRDAWQPATVSPLLTTTLLRRELGFNGLVVSDATSMGGFGSWGERETMLPALVQAGCDMVLFSREPAQDLAWLERGLQRGLLTEQRVDEALTRVLGLKAALGLHRSSIDERLQPLPVLRKRLATNAHLGVAERAAAASVTLVKNTGVLPLNLARHRRVVVASGGIESAMHETAAPLAVVLEELRARGFEVRAYDPEQPPTPACTDLLLYLLARESMMGHSSTEIAWARLHGGPRNAMRRHWHEIPTVMVSFGHPGCLLDAPRVPAYVNAYSAGAPVQRAVVRKLLGEEPFTGTSPIDAFCGQQEARW